MLKKIFIIFVVIGCLFFIWRYSEIKIAKAVRPPTGATNIYLFLQARPQPREIRKFIFKGKAYLEVIGHPFKSAFIIPSGPPVYIFDETGALVDWSRDIGDNSSFIKKWGNFSNATLIRVEEAKEMNKTVKTYP